MSDDEMIPFEDNKGNQMKLNKDLTIADLLKMGRRESRPKNE